MPTLGPNFRQELDPTDFEDLPEWASYEGDDPELQHLRHVMIPTKDVERVVPVGEREQVWVTLPGGERITPWKNCWIYEVDEYGEVVTDMLHTELPKYGPHAMSTADLAAVGMTDRDLMNLVKEHLGEVYEPDRPGPSDLRRAFYDRVMAKLDAEDEYEGTALKQ